MMRVALTITSVSVKVSSATSAPEVRRTWQAPICQAMATVKGVFVGGGGGGGEEIAREAAGEVLEGHDAGGNVVEEVDGEGAVGEVDGMGFWGAEAEAFEVAAGG